MFFSIRHLFVLLIWIVNGVQHLTFLNMKIKIEAANFWNILYSPILKTKLPNFLTKTSESSQQIQRRTLVALKKNCSQYAVHAALILSCKRFRPIDLNKTFVIPNIHWDRTIPMLMGFSVCIEYLNVCHQNVFEIIREFCQMFWKTCFKSRPHCRVELRLLN